MSKLSDIIEEMTNEVLEEIKKSCSEKEKQFNDDLEFIETNNPQIFGILSAVMIKVKELHDAVQHLYEHHSCKIDRSKETKH